jgi:hypothetical protein
MSEAAEAQEVDFEDAFEIEGEVEQEQEVEAAKVVEHDDKAQAPKMHIDKDTWIAQGRDPAKWVSPELFAERTERINTTQRLKQELKQQEKEFESRLKNVNLFQQSQIDRLRRELESKRDDAIDIADKGEVKRLDKELKELDDMEELSKPVEAAPSNLPPEVAEWNAENPWLTADHPLRQQINDEYVKAIQSGKTIAGALRAVDKLAAQLLKQEPATTKKTPRAIVDTPRGVVGKSQDDTSWKSLTREEVAIYDEIYSDLGMTKKEYLQTVADSRKGV